MYLYMEHDKQRVLPLARYMECESADQRTGHMVQPPVFQRHD